MAAPESPRLSSSLPNSPLEQPIGLPGFEPSSPGQSPDQITCTTTNPNRPSSSRREVAFSPNVEIIPRPLSTISSETESSISTVRGHSINNSISSILSMSMPSPASSRVRSPSLEVTPEHEPSPAPRSSVEADRSLEKEGEWFENGPSRHEVRRSISEPAVAVPRKLSFTAPDQVALQPIKSRPVHKRKQSLSHALGFTRRKSEPLISMHIAEPSRFSAISLQDSALSSYAPEENVGDSADHRSSTRKLKDWALSKLARKHKERTKSQSGISAPALQVSPPSARAETVSVAETSAPVAETDLDAVFGGEGLLPSPSGFDGVRPRSMIELNMPTFSQSTALRSGANDEPDSMLDLDAALGPFNSSSMGSQRQRRELHSSRLTRDFTGPGGHYHPSPSHRRAESAPMLTAFDMSRMSTPPQGAMADVFEEDEEEEEKDKAPPQQPPKSSGSEKAQDEESGIGIQVVDADPSMQNESGRRGFWCEEGDWVMERPTTSYGNQSSRLSTPVIERRPSSILDDTIEEEPSQTVETLEIVGDDEEPRASSFTKSSDSSETPTLLAPQAGLRPTFDGPRSVTALDTLQNPVFSSPDFGRRQGSFDTSRVGTSASSVTDNRTLNSSTTGGDLALEHRVSTDDVPSLTSSRSTMMTHGNMSRRDFSEMRTPSAHSTPINRTISAEQRRKRLSMQSLSNFVGGPFGSKTNLPDSRPQTASQAMGQQAPRRRESRLRRWLLWKPKQQPPANPQPRT